MLFLTLALVALTSTTIASHHLNENHMHLHDARNLNMLDKRQDYQPGTKTAPGDTCAAAFGSGYQTCADSAPNGNRFCFNPNVGEICCSNQWVCPPGNSCSNNYGGCCPPGVPAASCTASGTPSPSSTMVNAASTSTNSTTVALPTVSSVTCNGTAQTTGQQTSTSQLPKFTGAASRIELSVAGLVGVAGLVAGLL